MIFSLLVSFGAVFFAGCPEVLSPPVTPARGDTVLVVRIAGESPASRTALPAKPEPTTYNITVTRPGVPPLPLGGAAGLTGSGPFDVQLSSAPTAGDTVWVEGSYNGVKCAAGSAQLGSGNSVTVTLYPLPLTEGTGRIDLCVNIPTTFAGTDEITAAELSLYGSLDDYQAGKVYRFTRYRKNDTYGSGTDQGANLGGSVPIVFNELPSGNYVIQIEFFRLKYVRVSHLVQTVIVRGGLTTNTWDGVSDPLSWGENKFASSDAEPVDIKIDGKSIKTGGSLPAAHSIYTPVIAFPPQEKVSLTVTPKPGQNVAVSLNGGAPAGGGSHSLTMEQTNSIVIAVTAQDGVATRIYTVSYTYYNNSQVLYVAEGGSDDTGDGKVQPYKTVTRALKRIREIYNSGLGWPGKDSDKPVAVRINISGKITDAIKIEETGNRYDTLPPIILAGSGTNTNEIIAKESSRPLTINKAAVILGDGVTLTGGNHSADGGGVYVSGGSKFIMNGGSISGNIAPKGGGVFITGNAGEVYSSFTMNGGTISGGTGSRGVYVDTGCTFTMNGGTISGSAANGVGVTTDGYGGGVYVNTGAQTKFIMTGGTISGNTANYGGGGVYVKGSSFDMTGGTISGNTASGGSGGGVFVTGGSSFTMTGGTIEANTANSGDEGSGGGGVYVTSGVFTMTGGTIEANTLRSGNYGSGGGGVYVGANGDFTMTGGTISGNKASENSGGGVYVYNISFSGGSYKFTMSGESSINGNSGKRGGGVYMESGIFAMAGGSISGNTASESGGGVYVGGTPVEGRSGSPDFTMTGGSISGNTASESGGGVCVKADNTPSKFAMNGGTISGNTASKSGGGVYYTGGNFTMSAGTISGNTASGVQVSGSGSSFTMSGNAAVDTGNAVYLETNQVITLSGILTANPAANIVPSTTASGTTVLADDTTTAENDITLDDNYKKFRLNGESNKIDESGKIN